jgi:sec-independent protein translocase protein TatB
MFDIGWGELLLIGVVALIAIGPKELPGVLRSVGQWMVKIRSMASEFQNQFHEAIREVEVAEFAKQVDELNEAARGMTAQFDPMDYAPKETSPNASAADAAAPPAVPASEAAAAAPAVPSDTAAAPPAVESAPSPVPAADSLPPVEREEVTPAPGAQGGRPA